jgi:hypothetical protein
VSFLIAITPFRQSLRAQDSLRKYRANLIVFLEISLKSVPLVRKPPEAKAKFSLDLWCAIWFWPPEQIADCPLPNEFSKTEDGFDAIVGNPPWGIAKPNSKEFF